MRKMIIALTFLLAAGSALADDVAFDRIFQTKLKEARAQATLLLVDALFQKIQRKESFVLLDIRDKEEVEHTGAPVWEKYLHVSRGRLELSLVGLGLDVEEEVVVMCRNSIRSFLAAQTLREYGFKRVLVLDKGMDGWVGRGYPTHKPF